MSDGDTTHPSYDWARDHHEPHFALVEGAAARHDELMTGFRAEVGPLDEQKAVEALGRLMGRRRRLPLERRRP